MKNAWSCRINRFTLDVSCKLIEFAKKVDVNVSVLQGLQGNVLGAELAVPKLLVIAVKAGSKPMDAQKELLLYGSRVVAANEEEGVVRQRSDCGQQRTVHH